MPVRIIPGRFFFYLFFRHSWRFFYIFLPSVTCLVCRFALLVYSYIPMFSARSGAVLLCRGFFAFCCICSGCWCIRSGWCCFPAGAVLVHPLRLFVLLHLVPCLMQLFPVHWLRGRVFFCCFFVLFSGCRIRCGPFSPLFSRHKIHFFPVKSDFFKKIKKIFPVFFMFLHICGAVYSSLCRFPFLCGCVCHSGYIPLWRVLARPAVCA